MNPKKVFRIFIIILSLLLIGITACRKDDICTDEGTPDLKIKFFDAGNHATEKAVDTLYLIALPKQDTLVAGQTKVSGLSIPLNVNADLSKFIFVTQQNKDTVIFHYTRETIFVSKACGYKVIFHQLNVDLQHDNNNWIKQIDIIYHDVVNDSIHLKIYH